MTILQGGDDGRLLDRPLSVDTWYQDRNKIVHAVINPERTSTPDLRGQIPLGYQKVPMPFHQLPWDVSIQKQPPESLQYDALEG